VLLTLVSSVDTSVDGHVDDDDDDASFARDDVDADDDDDTGIEMLRWCVSSPA
jgi:hypothetical protein